MKKSELVTMIVTIIENKKEHSYDDIFFTTAAEAIVDALMEIGMKPPSICYKDGKFDSHRYAAHFHMGKDSCYWEKEDE